ncbi:MAG: chorismate mutase [Steroidobacteraceae bacterium]
MTLDELRAELTALDTRLLELIARRQALSEQVAEVKRATGHPTRDFAREREVVLRARATAERLKFSPELAESILRKLIDSSLARQEQAGVAALGRGTGRRALIIGGAGKMGGWFAEFLDSQGFEATISPICPAVVGDFGAARWEDLPGPRPHRDRNAARPCRCYTHWPRGHRPASSSTWVRSRRPCGRAFTALRSAGMRRHLHPSHVRPRHRPALGPPRHLHRPGPCRCALREAQELFAATMAERVVMDLDEHDRLIAYVLGLSHALNIAFFTALADSGEAAPRLARLSSTTFDSQLDVAGKVAAESPELYYEIQSLNEYGVESLEALQGSVGRLLAAVKGHDAQGFKSLMLRGRAYLEGRAAARTG